MQADASHSPDACMPVPRPAGSTPTLPTTGSTLDQVAAAANVSILWPTVWTALSGLASATQSMCCCYLPRLRRAAPNPSSPLPNSQTAAGSGTGATLICAPIACAPSSVYPEPELKA
jgi:hypothetical protein